MTLMPRCHRNSSDFKISKPTLTSSTGSAASETRSVSPMPCEQPPEADRGFNRARHGGAGFGNADMQG